MHAGSMMGLRAAARARLYTAGGGARLLSVGSGAPSGSLGDLSGLLAGLGGQESNGASPSASAPGSACDVVVVGGGSGGMACANRLAELGKRVVLFDHVAPSPQGTTWGFGGTCVNVGCIPKKLYHEAGRLESSMRHDGAALGLQFDRPPRTDWARLRATIQDFVKSLSFSYSVGVSPGVNLVRARASLLPGDELGVRYTNPLTGGEIVQHANDAVVIAVGGRPTLPDIPGAEHAITSDDLFALDQAPGKTLCVGGGYVSTEIAGFLGSLGFETTLAARSILLRGDGFDDFCTDKIRQMLDAEGVNVLLGTRPIEIAKADDGRLGVTLAGPAGDDTKVEWFDTVLFGTGRRADLAGLGLGAQVAIDPHSHKICVDDALQSTQPGIYAIGDAAQSGMPELTPVAIRQGEVLAEHLAAADGATRQVGLFDAVLARSPRLAASLVPSTVFTPSEYGRIGLSEQAACDVFGPENVETYIIEWQTLLSAATHRERHDGGEFPYQCAAKVVCLKNEGERVVGLHMVSPQAGEALQGFAVAVNLGATKRDLDARALGIHPTDSEALVGLRVTTRSGEDYIQRGGCGGGRCG